MNSKSKISDLRNAIVLLGYYAVRNAIVSLSVINAFPKRVKLIDFDISQFWKHSLAVAVTSKKLPSCPKRSHRITVLSAGCCMMSAKSS